MLSLIKFVLTITRERHLDVNETTDEGIKIQLRQKIIILLSHDYSLNVQWQMRGRA